MATKYTVLVQVENEGWAELQGEYEANNDKEACRKAFLENPTGITAIVAVPARSWNPKPIRVEPKAVFGN